MCFFSFDNFDSSFLCMILIVIIHHGVCVRERLVQGDCTRTAVGLLNTDKYKCLVVSLQPILQMMGGWA